MTELGRFCQIDQRFGQGRCNSVRWRPRPVEECQVLPFCRQHANCRCSPWIRM